MTLSNLIRKISRVNRENFLSLLEKGLDIEMEDEYGCTLLHHVCEVGNIELAELLVQKNANINATDEMNRTPLFHAVYGGRVEVVKLLIQNGADLSEKDVNGISPLQEAIFNGFSAIVLLLAEDEAAISAMGESLSDLLVIAEVLGCFEIENHLKKLANAP